MPLINRTTLINFNLSSIVKASTAATHIFEMIGHVPEIDVEDDKGKVLAYVHREIVFRKVYFSYPSRMDSPALQGLNLKLKAGNTVGLVEESGFGKSTVISLGDNYIKSLKFLFVKSARARLSLSRTKPLCLRVTSVLQ